MSKGLEIEIKGIDSLLKRMGDMSATMADNIDKSMNKSIVDINRLQKQLTPVDNGVLRQGNGFDASKKLDKALFNNVEYSPYVEFGTGGMVSIPAGLEDIAIQFKGKGIKKVNLPARPFFFRAFFEKRKELMDNISKSIVK